MITKEVIRKASRSYGSEKGQPESGDIHVDVDIVAQAKTYEENGAVILTDEVFSGQYQYLRENI